MPMDSTASQTGEPGHLHPVTSVIREITTIFSKMGFSVAQGPELEQPHDPDRRGGLRNDRRLYMADPDLVELS